MNAPVIATNWIVLTGAPCSGKTALLRALRELGQATCDEAAERYVLSQRRNGNATADIIKDRMLLTREITRLALEQESLLPAQQRVFLDRSAFDSIAYCRVFANKEIPFLESILSQRYARVFLLDRLAITDDRFENSAEAAAIDGALFDAYTQYGYEVVRVPIMPISDRAIFILGLL